MIIVRSPQRISLVGGGTDVPHWLDSNNGLVVGMAIQQYGYITIREMPRYFDYKYRLTYSEIETAKEIQDIRHNVIRNVLEYYHVNTPLEIHFICDVPGKSGLGSSSTFLTALVAAVRTLIYKQPFTKMDLYKDVTNIEQNVLKECIGFQDTAWAVFGGINGIGFTQNGKFNILPIHLSQYATNNLLDHILLFYTNIPRQSSDIAAKYYPSVKEREQEMLCLTSLAAEAYNALDTLSKDETDIKCIRRLGTLLESSWTLKKMHHPDVSNPVIDNAINQILSIGGHAKVSGAGQGSIIVMCNPNQRNEVRRICSNFTEIAVKPDYEGTKIIYDNGRAI